MVDRNTSDIFVPPGTGSGAALGDLATPATDEAASTQDVADAITAANAALAAANAAIAALPPDTVRTFGTYANPQSDEVLSSTAIVAEFVRQILYKGTQPNVDALRAIPAADRLEGEQWAIDGNIYTWESGALAGALEPDDKTNPPDLTYRWDVATTSWVLQLVVGLFDVPADLPTPVPGSIALVTSTGTQWWVVGGAWVDQGAFRDFIVDNQADPFPPIPTASGNSIAAVLYRNHIKAAGFWTQGTSLTPFASIGESIAGVADDKAMTPAGHRAAMQSNNALNNLYLGEKTAAELTALPMMDLMEGSLAIIGDEPYAWHREAVAGDFEPDDKPVTPSAGYRWEAGALGGPRWTLNPSILGVFPTLAAAPGAPAAGSVVLIEADGLGYFWTGTWFNIGLRYQVENAVTAPTNAPPPAGVGFTWHDPPPGAGFWRALTL